MKNTRKLIANLGDVNPFENGGFFVFEYADGSTPNAELLEVGDEDGNGMTHWTVYTISLDRHYFENGILSDNEFHKDQPAWFADKLDSVTESMGWNLAAFIAALCSDNVKSRAWAYQQLVSYFGPDGFDSYPYRIETLKEAKQRYKGFNKV